jgi:hypothetical protein
MKFNLKEGSEKVGLFLVIFWKGKLEGEKKNLERKAQITLTQNPLKTKEKGFQKAHKILLDIL